MGRFGGEDSAGLEMEGRISWLGWLSMLFSLWSHELMRSFWCCGEMPFLPLLPSCLRSRDEFSGFAASMVVTLAFSFVGYPSDVTDVVRLLVAKEKACCGDSMALLPIQSSLLSFRKAAERFPVLPT
jgi:hypothetical protein